MSIAFPEPDAGILSRREEIIAGLAKLVPSDCLVTSEDERRAYDTDALTSYRKMPLAVVLPRSTQEVGMRTTAPGWITKVVLITRF